jgi:hypothetical protein
MQVTFYLRDTGWLNRRKTGMKFSRVSTGTGYMTGQETGRKGSGTGIRNQESCKRHDLQFCSGPTGPGSQLETHRLSCINEVYGSVSQAMDEERCLVLRDPETRRHQHQRVRLGEKEDSGPHY